LFILYFYFKIVGLKLREKNKSTNKHEIAVCQKEKKQGKYGEFCVVNLKIKQNT